MDHLACCDLLAAEIGKFAAIVDQASPQLPIGSCPGWSMADLTAHLGTVHRWAEHLVRARAQHRVPSEQMGLGLPQASAEWIVSGGRALVDTLRACDPGAPMWAWGQDQHARFWSRRQLHETLVHRMDVELAMGLVPEAAAAEAADAVDEFLANLAPAARFSPRVANLRGQGASLLFSATDAGRAWRVRLAPGGFEVESADADADEASLGAQATLSGPALNLLLVLYRRRPRAVPGLNLHGDEALVDFWLANSAME